MASRRVPEEWLRRATEIRDAGAAEYADLVRSVLADTEIAAWAPDSRVSVDPRTGTRTVYSPARARRPHDHPPPPPPEPEECIVCAGRTTSVVDRAPLSVGETFVNKNLYPIVYPRGAGDAHGLHLLQWVSTEHDVDLHNMPLEDLAIVIERLAVLEDRLYESVDDGMPRVRPGQYGHVGVIKNVGRLVGGSLVHGHQQIVHTNVRPAAFARDAAFADREGESFGEYILRENPEALTVAEYGGRFRLLVPRFMARPLDALVVAEDDHVEDLRDLDAEGRLALARALRDVTAAVVGLMPELGRETAYNLAVHNGIAGRLYVEILPYTQERGGYEALGLNLCEGTPEDSADRYRSFLGAR